MSNTNKTTRKQLRELYIEELGQATGGAFQATTLAIGEEDDGTTTRAISIDEEDEPTTRAISIDEEDEPTTRAILVGEE